MSLRRTGKKTSVKKKSVAKRATSRKASSSKISAHAVRAKKTTRSASHGAKSRGSLIETYVFECTRPGCGYQIVREEKAEVGETRFDLKCPKCHNTEFKSLGKGDLHPAMELTFPTSTIDFSNINPVDLGSN